MTIDEEIGAFLACHEGTSLVQRHGPLCLYERDGQFLIRNGGSIVIGRFYYIDNAVLAMAEFETAVDELYPDRLELRQEIVR